MTPYKQLYGHNPDQGMEELEIIEQVKRHALSP